MEINFLHRRRVGTWRSCTTTFLRGEFQRAPRPLALHLLATLGAAGRGGAADARAAARTAFHFAILQVVTSRH